MSMFGPPSEPGIIEKLIVYGILLFGVGSAVYVGFELVWWFITHVKVSIS